MLNSKEPAGVSRAGWKRVSGESVIFLNFVVDHLLWIVLGLGGFIALTKVRIRQEVEVKATTQLRKAIETQMHEPLTLHPEIDPAQCIGCGACTSACPEGDILKLINHKAVMVSPTKCVGHGECEAACPIGAIQLVFGTKTRGMDIPRVSTNFESNVPGLYIAGELGGMGLIRNATRQGGMAAEHALKNLSRQEAQCDLLVVGAGPAGFAASLVAIARGKSYICIDQQAFGGTIYNFPRQKLVMSHPFQLPIVGEAKFQSNQVSKEQLLGYWKRVQKQTGFKVREGVRFEGLEQHGEIFQVRTSKGIITARKVILAMGVRGSPRKLGVPGEDKQKVTYNLLDPEQYQGKQIVVVGAGNAAAEVAQMLADAKWRNTVHMLVATAVMDRCNDENKARLMELVKKGRLQIMYSTTVQKIEDDHIVIKKQEESLELANDFVFAMIGAEMPHKFLMGLGVRIEKKFGEGLRTTA